MPESKEDILSLAERCRRIEGQNKNDEVKSPLDKDLKPCIFNPDAYQD